MNGGLGDHIEALSLLLPWAKAQNCCLNLEMDAAAKTDRAATSPMEPNSMQ